MRQEFREFLLPGQLHEHGEAGLDNDNGSSLEARSAALM
jgi:hypothetical protein